MLIVGVLAWDVVCVIIAGDAYNRTDESSSVSGNIVIFDLGSS